VISAYVPSFIRKSSFLRPQEAKGVTVCVFGIKLSFSLTEILLFVAHHWQYLSLHSCRPTPRDRSYTSQYCRRPHCYSAPTSCKLPPYLLTYLHTRRRQLGGAFMAAWHTSATFSVVSRAHRLTIDQFWSRVLGRVA